MFPNQEEPVATIQYQLLKAGPPRLLRPPRPGPCLNFGFQLTLFGPRGADYARHTTTGLVWLKFAVAALNGDFSSLICRKKIVKLNMYPVFLNLNYHIKLDDVGVCHKKL